ncbi:MAG: hypothetical protein WCQ44_13285 [Opitutaceae bacterium]
MVYDPERESQAKALLPEVAGLLESSRLAELHECWKQGYDLILPLASVEDGSLQGSLEFLGFPYLGPSLTEAVLSNDPEYLGPVPTPPFEARHLAQLAAEAQARQRESEQLLSTFRDRL